MSKKNKKMPTDAELLLELATLDEVEAEVPTASEHTAGIVPGWCELRLKIKRTDTPDWPLNLDIPLRRHDGELICQVIHDVLHPEHTSSSGEAIWDAMDAAVERIMKRRVKGKDPKPQDLGEALGLATAIAYLNNPMEPNVDDVRWAATERWNIRHADD